MKAIAGLFYTASWFAGMVIAKGFWSTFFAIFTLGFWSAYLVAERALMTYGWI